MQAEMDTIGPGYGAGQGAHAAALMAWWQLAGVDWPAGDQPYLWLAPSMPTALSAMPKAASRAPAALRSAEASPTEDFGYHATLDALLEAVRATHPMAPLIDGAVDSGTLLVGDAPSAEDLQSGRPLSGGEGALVDRMMAAIGLDRTGFAATLLTPRRTLPGLPPADAVARDLPLIRALIRLAAPKRLLLLGALPAQALAGDRRPIAALRGQWLQLDVGGPEPIPALVTLKPGYLLKQPRLKADAWADLLTFQDAIP